MKVAQLTEAKNDETTSAALCSGNYSFGLFSYIAVWHQTWFCVNMSLTASWSTAASSSSANFLHIVASVTKLYNLLSAKAVR